ncbi:geranylgeranyltransferase type I alpha subunit [Scheffersomyces xylosifermentans]|uniref:geranylgeranyltransferase type I alpha subunit n=1 Tax=Scheffersomyces xylosifermentans TaxID=1304137 RepID=UPI00315DF48F
MATDYNFDDVETVKINEETPQLCQILYDDEYKHTIGILLGLLQIREYSERALYLTEKALELLASHYTIWIYRYDILVHLNKDLFEELDWCEQVALENEKNYQIWNYRQLIITRILATTDESSKKKFDPHREFPILQSMLESDPKNHHVWSYRMWLVKKFNLFKDDRENEFVNKCISADLWNNSAWSHRFFLKFSQEKDIPEETFATEKVYVQDYIIESPQNPSTWNYLTGIYKKYNKSIVDLEDFCLKFVDIEKIDDPNYVKSSFAIELLAKIFVKQQKNEASIQLYDILGSKYDPIRSNYWDYEKKKLISH